MSHAFEEKLIGVVSFSTNGRYSHLKVLYGLRSIAKNYIQKDINVMLMKHNFRDSDKNAEGIFTNDFQLKVINNDKVITDYFTGLMWH